MSKIQYFCEVKYTSHPIRVANALPEAARLKFSIVKGDREYGSKVDLVEKVKKEVARDLFESLRDYACYIQYRITGVVPFGIEAKSKWHEIDGRVDASEPKKD